MLSLPLVGFSMWGGNTNKVISPEVTKSNASESDKNRPNVLLVTFDALTAQDMSVYGYHLETTPFIEKWANTATLFTRTKAGSSYTAATTQPIPARVWTGKYHHDISPPI
jgi:arylsulfatase A-like enzyme